MLRAATGSGKTTLLRNWAARRAESTFLLWLTVHSSVGSRQAFWTRVTESARRAGDLDADRSSMLLQRVGVGVDPVDVAIDLLRPVGAVVFIFDAYENVGAAATEIDEDILRLVAELPDVRIVIGTRGGTGLTDEMLQLRHTVQVITDDQLAFNADEVAELLRLHLDRGDPVLARSTLRATHGYAIALRAMVLAMSRRTVIPVAGSDDWNRLVATDLASVLPDDSAAEFVALTSVAPYVDLDLAVGLTARSDAEELLELLERQGFGRWIPYAYRHPVFQYVDSVRSAFLRELRRRDVGAYRRSAGRTAQWLVGYGDHELAFQLALDAADYPLAVRVYLDLLRIYPESYLTDRLLRPLNSVPHHVLCAHPMLAFALGLARLTDPVTRGTARDAFAIAVEHRATSPIAGPDIDGFINLSLRAVSRRFVGDFNGSARESLAATAKLGGVSADRLDELREPIAMILRQLSFSLLQGGQPDAAVAVLSRSASLSRLGSTRNYALSYLVGAHAFAGELPRARAALSQIDPAAWPRDHASIYLNAMTTVGESLLHSDAMEFDRAVGVIDRGWYTETAEFWPLLTAALLVAKVGSGEALAQTRRVQSVLDAALPPNGVGDNLATRTLHGFLAIAWLSAGRAGAAERLLSGDHDDGRAELAAARALHLLLTGSAGQVIARLPGWLATAGHSVRSKAATLTFGAAAALRTGDGSMAVSLLRRAEELTAVHGVQVHLAWLPIDDRRALAELCRHAGATSIGERLDAVTVDVMPAQVSQIALTGRESVVLAALTTTASREEIARRLQVSANTVKTQIRHIYRKLGVNDRAAALRAAIEHQLLEDS